MKLTGSSAANDYATSRKPIKLSELYDKFLNYDLDEHEFVLVASILKTIATNKSIKAPVFVFTEKICVNLDLKEPHKDF